MSLLATLSSGCPKFSFLTTFPSSSERQVHLHYAEHPNGPPQASGKHLDKSNNTLHSIRQLLHTCTKTTPSKPHKTLLTTMLPLFQKLPSHLKMATSPRPVPPTVAASPPTSRSPSPTRQPSAGPDSPILEGLHGAVNEDEEENSNVINTILRFLRRRRRWVDGHLLGSGQEGDRGGEGRTEVLVLDQVEWEVYERAVSFLEWERVEGTGGWRGLL